MQRLRARGGYGPFQGSDGKRLLPITQWGVLPHCGMRIGDKVLHLGRVLVLIGHDPMSVPDRRAQVEDPETGERFDVPYDELEPAQGFDAGP